MTENTVNTANTETEVKETKTQSPADIFAANLVGIKKNIDAIDVGIAEAEEKIKTLEKQRLMFRGAYNATVELGIKLGYFKLDEDNSPVTKSEDVLKKL